MPPGTRAAIVEVLNQLGIDPDTPIDPNVNGRTAYEIMEAHVMAAIDEIEGDDDFEDDDEEE
jgi:hypothetical protein